MIIGKLNNNKPIIAPPDEMAPKRLVKTILVRRVKVRPIESPAPPVNTHELVVSNTTFANVYKNYDVNIDIATIKAGLRRLPHKPLIICPVQFIAKGVIRKETLFCNREMISDDLSIDTLINAAVNLPGWLNRISG